MTKNYKLLLKILLLLLIMAFCKPTILNAAEQGKATVSFDETYMEDESREEAITEFECSILTDGKHFGYLQEYVTKLPEAYQDVLMYRYVEEMNCRQIAKLLNVSESTVSTRVNRALKQLARLFEEGRMRV